MSTRIFRRACVLGLDRIVTKPNTFLIGTATDTQVWERGRVESLVIFSKDVDFYDRALVFGAPPQVVHIAVGNCSNARLFEVLEHEWDDVERLWYLEKIEVFV